MIFFILLFFSILYIHTHIYLYLYLYIHINIDVNFFLTWFDSYFVNLIIKLNGKNLEIFLHFKQTNL